MSVNTIHIEQNTVFSRDAETQLFALLADGATLGVETRSGRTVCSPLPLPHRVDNAERCSSKRVRT